MEHYEIGHNKGGAIGAVLSISLWIIGKITLSDVAIIVSIIAGSLSAGYTSWKWITEVKKRKHLKHKNKV